MTGKVFGFVAGGFIVMVGFGIVVPIITLTPIPLTACGVYFIVGGVLGLFFEQLIIGDLLQKLQDSQQQQQMQQLQNQRLKDQQLQQQTPHQSSGSAPLSSSTRVLLKYWSFSPVIDCNSKISGWTGAEFYYYQDESIDTPDHPTGATMEVSGRAWPSRPPSTIK